MTKHTFISEVVDEIYNEGKDGEKKESGRLAYRYGTGTWLKHGW